MLAVHLVLGLVLGIVTAAIAAHKGRNAVGWFFFGFFFGLIALIVVCVVSNLKEERARYERAGAERRRLREELRLERMRAREAHLSANLRLDLHDRALGVDTRKAGAPPPLTGGATAALEAPGAPAEAPSWYYADDEGGQVGPLALDALAAAWTGGIVRSDTLVWKTGWKEWHRLVEVNGLQEKLGG